jgi:hypothetical protein
VNKLLLETSSLEGIAKVLDVSEMWLQGYVSGIEKQVKMSEYGPL